MASAGDIKVHLVLDGGEAFIKRVKTSADSLDRLSISTQRVTRRTDTMLGKTRDLAIILGLARSAVENLGLVFTSIPTTILQQNAMLERSTVLMAGMDTESRNYADSMERAKEQVRELIAMSSNSPYGLDSITDSFAKLKSANIPDTANAMKTMVDAAAKSGATSEQLNRLAVAFQQMSGKGVISMEELRQQAGEAIPQIMRYMSRATRMSMGEMVKMISDGSMEAQSALRELFKEMAFSSMGAGYAMSQTLTGTYNRVKNAWLVMSKEVGESGFNDSMREAGEAMIEAMGSDAMIDNARAFGRTMKDIVELLMQAAKFAQEYGKIIATVGAGMIASSLANKGVNTAVNYWMLAKEANTEYNRQAQKNAGKYNRRLERLYKERKKMQDAAVKAAQNYAEGSMKPSLQAVEKFHRETEVSLTRTIDSSIRKYEKMQRHYTSTFTKMRTVGRQFFNAMGGWVTMAVGAVIGLIAVYDELYGKQKRAAQELIRTSGLNATASMLDGSEQRLKQIDTDTKAIEKKIKDAEQASKRSKGRTTEDIVRVDTSDLKKQLEALQKEKQDIERVLSSGYRSMTQSAEQFGKSTITGLLGEAQLEISKTYTKMIEAREDRAKEMGLAGAEYSAWMTEGIEAIGQLSVNTMKAEGEKRKKEIGEQIKVLEDRQQKDGGLNAFDTRQLAEYRGQVAGINEDIERYQEMVKRGNIEELTMGARKLSAAESMTNQLKEQAAIYQSKIEEVRDGKDYGQNEAKVLAGIASGRLKGEQEILDALRAQAIATDKIREEYEKVIAERNKHKENERNMKAANDRVDNMLISMAKRLGTASGRSLNEYMKWQIVSKQNSEAIREMLSQVEKSAKDLGRALTPDEKAKFAELERLKQEIDLSNIRYQQEKAIHDYKLESMNVMDSYLYQTQMEVDHLEEVKQSLRDKLATEELSNEQHQKTLSLMALIDENMANAAENAKKLNPKVDAFYRLSDEIDDMAYQIDDELVNGFTGAMDQWIDSMYDAEASFHHVMKNMGNELAKYITKMLLLKAIQQGMGMIMGSFGGPASSTAGEAISGVSNGIGMEAMPVTGFAMGGIMTKYGEVPLKQYANGGIANSPQLALFGEGKMNEAYVPLPDGRSIPVTIEGGKQSQPVINVINQTGVQADVEQNTRFDGEKYITDVVMKAAARPGKFRNTMRGR